MKNKKFLAILLIVLIVFSSFSCKKELTEKEKQNIIVGAHLTMAIAGGIGFIPNTVIVDNGNTMKLDDNSLIATKLDDVNIKVELKDYTVDLKNNVFAGNGNLKDTYQYFFPNRTDGFVDKFTFTGTFDSTNSSYIGKINNNKVNCSFKFKYGEPIMTKIIINDEDCTNILNKK